MAAMPQEVVDARLGRVTRAIYEYLEKTQEDGRRAHLGASLIGKLCRRQVWYTWRWAKNIKHEGRLLQLFKTGHLAEPRFIDDLKAIGAQVVSHDENGQQFRFTAHGGHFAGSLDGVATGLPYAPKTWAVLEFKTHSHKSFLTLVSKGVKIAKPEHYSQMQIYMLEMGLDRALYLAKDKDKDEMHDEWITLDKPFAEAEKAKALAIIQADIPPAGVAAEPGAFECKFCDFKDLCFGEQVPEPTCRSCAHATPVLDRPQPDGSGTWACARWESDIPLDAQRAGCGGHRYIPIFLANVAEPQDYHNGDVVYRVRKNGKLFANGEGPAAFSSAEIHACPDKAGIPIAGELKGMFPTAKIIG